MKKYTEVSQLKWHRGSAWKKTWLWEKNFCELTSNRNKQKSIRQVKFYTCITRGSLRDELQKYFWLKMPFKRKVLVLHLSHLKKAKRLSKHISMILLRIVFSNWEHFPKDLYCFESMYKFKNQIFQNYQKKPYPPLS